MTPQSVGVPRLQAGAREAFGRHALSLRCEQLGYQFERRELDEVYRKLSCWRTRSSMSKIITCCSLIRETQHETPRIPPAHVDMLRQ